MCSSSRGPGSLTAFAVEHFFCDADLARECSANHGVKGMLQPRYWVLSVQPQHQKHYYVHLSSYCLRNSQIRFQLIACHGADGVVSDGLQVELGQLVLKRFLLLVLLLEKAATAGDLPPGVPLLFKLNSPIKSSAEVCIN